MNKEITIYELLGLIKDNKVPNSIIYKREYFKYSKENRDYIGENNYLFSDFADLISILNDKVEIIDEDKKIEKLNIENDSPTQFYIRNEYGTKCSLTKHSKIIADKLNEVIDYINRREDK